MIKNIAVIGCGHWGKNLVRNFHELGNLAAVVEENEKLGQQFSKQFNVPLLSLQETFNNNEIQGIVIALPAEMHFNIAKSALEHKKDVFVEKPLALKIEDAIILREIAHENKCILMVGHLLQYHPAFLKLKQFVKQGKLGSLQYIYSNRLNLGKFRREENILWSFAPHDISMILSLTDEIPNKVTASGANYLHDAIADVTTTHLSFACGVKAHIFVSWLHPFKEQKLVVIGSKGMALFDDNKPWQKKLQLFPHKITWLDGQPLPKKAKTQAIALEELEPLNSECKHFIDCIQTRTQPRTNAVEGVNVLKVLELAEESLKNNQAIPPDTSEKCEIFKHDSAVIASSTKIDAGTKVWHFSHILNNCYIGKNCNIGQNVMIGPDVSIGSNCKIQNNVSIYKGVTLEDGVFCGPSCVFTNVINPRAEIESKKSFLPTLVKKGATIGANATILCGNSIGSYALVGAGSVVTKDVPSHALVVGVPAKQVGWVSHSGDTLNEDLICPSTGKQYQLDNNGVLTITSSTRCEKNEVDTITRPKHSNHVDL